MPHFCGQEAFGARPGYPSSIYLQVDGRRFPGMEDGVQLVVVDGARGHVLGRASFRNVVLQGAPWQLANYVGALPDG